MRTPALPGARRQLRFPEEFRIEPIPEPSPPPEPAAETVRPTHVVNAPEDVEAADDAARRIATEVWKAARWTSQEKAEKDPAQSIRVGARHVVRVTKHLQATGVEAHDFDGKPYDPGMQVSVLAFQEVPAATAPTVMETVTPAVTRDNRLIQEAEVIVGVPPGWKS